MLNTLGLVWTVFRHGPTLYALVAWNAHQMPNAVALVDENGSLTYADLLARADAMAAALAHRIKPGEAVGLLCSNSADSVAALLACVRIGARTVLLNTSFSATEIGRVGREQRLRLLICDGDWPERLREEVEAGLTVLTLAELKPANAKSPPLRLPRIGPLVLLTSGSTGTPKAVRSRVGLRAGLRMAGALLDALPLRAGAPTLLPLPLFHGHGLATLGMGLAMGAPLHLCRPNTQDLWRTLQMEGIEVLVLVPTLLHRLLDVPGTQAAPTLRAIICGSAPLGASLATIALDHFGDVLFNLYGSTETGLISLATPADLIAAPGSVGRTLPGVNLELRGEVGRVIVNGHDTGDLASRDAAGRLTLHGRADELLICGGENVFPASLEERIVALDAVAECAVVGVPCTEFGTGIHAFIVPKPGCEITPEQIQDELRPLLPRMFRPQKITLLDALPRTQTGKLLRSRLPAEAHMKMGATDEQSSP
ncbi:AMP-binding protein [Deinococcus marmoris]|uniref:Long-chain-fatty-acid--CoA ligase n=1 Tax=Deinococcus marmoris TaxID=249408 RepID=A0A1U7NUI1_9DEIO|nr:AMP-binding protein [Deinococcus marmoris]OLV16565.1 Long-chain-fatty-acid--CoA ligase [Deinococcus marmoris]